MSARLEDMGCARSVNPARRELRVRPGPGSVAVFDPGGWVRIVLRDGTSMRCKFERMRAETGEAVLTLAAGVTRDNVARMKGARVMMETWRNVRDADTEYDAAALEGFEVRDLEGAVLGTVTGVYATEANAAIAVARPGGGGFLTPVIDAVIADVDWEQGVVVVNDTAPYTVEDAD